MAKTQLIKSKKFYYCRAYLGGKSQNNLQKLLSDAHAELETAQSRTFAIGDGGHINGVNFKEKSNVGLLLHIAAYVPDQPTSTISKDFSGKASAIFAEPAPDGKDYLDGDIFVLVRNNHVIFCPSGVRENTALTYFRKMLEKHGNKKDALSLKLVKVANIDKLKMIRKEGVTKISLGTSLYEASLHHMDKKNPRVLDIVTAISEQLSKIFSKDMTLKDIGEKENINVTVSLRFDGQEARKHRKDPSFGHLGLERLMKTSEYLLKEDSDLEDDFKIVTRSGNTITQEQIRVCDEYKIKVLGKSLSCIDAWEKLEHYAMRLEKTGIFSQ